MKPAKPSRLSGWLSTLRASWSEVRSGLKAEGPVWLLEWVNWKKLGLLVAWFMTPVAILGVTLSSLHQSTLGTLYLNMPHRLHPLWFSPLMSLMFFISSIMTGVSVAIIAYLIAARIHGKEADPEAVDGLGKIVAWVTLLYVVLKLVEIWLAGEMPMLLAFDRPSLLMWLELGVGAIVPMILLFIPAVRRHKVGRWVCPLLIIFGVFANRFNATLFAQMLPPSTPGYTPHILEWLSTLGILAGVALVWYLAVRWFVRFDERGHHAG